MQALSSGLRLRLLPALLTASGIALLASGLMSYTTAVEAAPEQLQLADYDPLPTLDTTITLPGASAQVAPTFPPDRVVTRIVIRRLNIDLPVMLQTEEYGIYPLCDVAMYQPQLGQPGENWATYIYAHAQYGMFLPLLKRSERADSGESMLGMIVEVYTSDDWMFLYRITEVRRHTRTMADAFATKKERLFMQTSEGVRGTIPKLQVVADYVSSEKTSPAKAHPDAHPRICG